MSYSAYLSTNNCLVLLKKSALVLLVSLSNIAFVNQIPAEVFAENSQTPLIIAHRGSSGLIPEHTAAAYSLAVFQGADFIEPDLVFSKDGQLIVRHDNLLDLSTDVANHREFSGRRITKTIDGNELTGFFSEDFSWVELKSLKAIERIPKIRPTNTRLNGQLSIMRFQDVLDLANKLSEVTGRKIGVYPELKHSHYYKKLGYFGSRQIISDLKKHGFDKSPERVFIQSFEVDILRQLKSQSNYPLIQLIWSTGGPIDQSQKKNPLTYAQMSSPEGLKEISKYASGVGPEKKHFLMPLEKGRNWIKAAHEVGLKVHAYTFRAENHFLAEEFKNKSETSQYGAYESEWKKYLALGLDGIFTDHPGLMGMLLDREAISIKNGKG